MSLGKYQTIEPSEFYEGKRNRLARHMAIVIMAVSTLYTILLFIFQVNVPPMLLGSTFLAGLLTYLLGRFKYYTLSKIVGLTIIDLVVFAAATSESERTNIFLYFGAIALASVVVFGYEDRWKGYIFVMLSAVLYIITRFSSIQILPYRNFTQDQIQIFFVINVLVFSYVCAYIIFVLLRSNFLSERILMESNKRVLMQNDELVRTNAELDRFMYSTSHDMRAPLSSLTGLIKLSEMTTDVAEVKEYIRMMKGSIGNLEKFTLDITDHYRNSRTDVQLEKIRLKELLDEIISDLSFGDGPGKIKFKTNITDEIDLLTDPSRLRVVLNNIVSNCIKYSDPKADVPIVNIHYAKNGEKHRIDIQDNGIGIGENHLEKIFEMFYRASETSRGSGLGLYIVKETMNKLRGVVRVTSNLGEGTTFQIELPIVEQSEAKV